MTTYVRAGSEEEIYLYAKRNGVAMDLSLATRVVFNRIHPVTGTNSAIDSNISPSYIWVSNGPQGEVTVHPATTYWVYVGAQYKCYLDVYINGRKYSFPGTGNEIFEVVESAP